VKRRQKSGDKSLDKIIDLAIIRVVPFSFHKNMITGCGKASIRRHSRKSGSPEGIEKTGFPLPRE
jgi:hypothetical protein